MRIASRDNRHIKEITKLLSSGRSRKENGLFVVEGARICTDAAESGIVIATLLYSDSAALRYPKAVARLSQAARLALSAPDEVFAKAADTKTPQGILAVCEIPAQTLDIEKLRADGRYAALENLSDPANLGTIARTAEALGIDGLILSPGCCDPYGPKALRAGMGSLIRIPLRRSADFLGDLRRARQSGLTVLAAVPDAAAARVTDVLAGTGTVVLIGNEGNGLTQEAKAAADLPVTIPMAGRAESLNAAAAASILMWEMVRKNR